VAEDVTPKQEAPGEAPKQEGRTWTDLLTTRNIIGAIIVVAALLFIFQNTGTGHFHFLFFDIKAPEWIWLAGVFAAGFVGGILFAHHRAKTAKTK
jgi:uncharacterized integral membrane protein